MARRKGLADHMEDAPRRKRTGHSLAPTVWGKARAFSDMMDESGDIDQRLSWAREIAPDGGYGADSPYNEEAVALLAAAYASNGVGAVGDPRYIGLYRPRRKQIYLNPTNIEGFVGQDLGPNEVGPSAVLAHETGHAIEDRSLGGIDKVIGPKGMVGALEHGLFINAHGRDNTAKTLDSAYDTLLGTLNERRGEWANSPTERFAELTQVFLRDPETFYEAAPDAYVLMRDLLKDANQIMGYPEEFPRSEYRYMDGTSLSDDDLDRLYTSKVSTMRRR